MILPYLRELVRTILTVRLLGTMITLRKNTTLSMQQILESSDCIYLQVIIIRDDTMPKTRRSCDVGVRVCSTTPQIRDVGRGSHSYLAGPSCINHTCQPPNKESRDYSCKNSLRIIWDLRVRTCARTQELSLVRDVEKRGCQDKVKNSGLSRLCRRTFLFSAWCHPYILNNFFTCKYIQSEDSRIWGRLTSMINSFRHGVIPISFFNFTLTSRKHSDT